MQCKYICGICGEYFGQKENFDLHFTEHDHYGNQSSTSGALNWPTKNIDGQKCAISAKMSKQSIGVAENANANSAETTENFQIEHQYVCTKCDKGHTTMHDHPPCSKSSVKAVKEIKRPGITSPNVSGQSPLPDSFAENKVTNANGSMTSKQISTRKSDRKPLRQKKKKKSNETVQRKSVRVSMAKLCQANKKLNSMPTGSCCNSNLTNISHKNKIANRVSTRSMAVRSSCSIKKESCCLCPYKLPSFEMGLNHYAEVHDLRIFECPAPHCADMFRRISKWSRHFLKSHEDVVLPEGSEFKTILDEIVSDFRKRDFIEWPFCIQFYSLVDFVFQMEQVYQQSIAEGLIRISVINDDIASAVCSTPLQLNRNELNLSEMMLGINNNAPLISTIILISDSDADDTNPDDMNAINMTAGTGTLHALPDLMAAHDIDIVCEILEYTPGIDVKPVIKLENMEVD